MTNFIDSPIVQDILMVLAVLITSYLHKKKPQIQQEISKVLPKEEATITNELLDLIDRMTESAVQDANTRIVNGLKQHSLFTPDTAQAVKRSVMDNVVNTLPNAPNSIEWIVGQLIEKHVLKFKNK